MKLRPRLLLLSLALGLPVLAAVGGLQAYFEARARRDALADFVSVVMQSGERERCEAEPRSWSGGLPPRHEHGARSGPLQAPGPGASMAGDVETSRELRKRPPPHHPHEPEGVPPPLGTLGGAKGGRPRAGRAQLFAYDASFASANPAAPVLSQALREAMVSGEASASIRVGSEERPLREALFRMPWNSGPCVFILARQPEPPKEAFIHRGLYLLQVGLLPLLFVIAGVLVAVGPLVERVRRLTHEVRASAKEGYVPAVSVTGADELGELAKAFQEARSTIRGQMEQQAQRERSLRDFLDNTTHDVMIPLTVLQGHLSQLQAETGSTGSAGERLDFAESESQRASLLSSAMVEAHYMASLIHNLSVAAKLEGGEPPKLSHPVDLGSLLQRCVARHQPVARRRQVSIDFAIPERPMETLGDLTLIEQAVSNIIYNAVRYNHPHGHVAATLEVQQPEVQQPEVQPEFRFVLRVVDDGPGIPDAELARMLERHYERHYRGNEARTREPEGQGIGLSITFKVAVLHGFTLRLSRSEFGGLQVELAGPLHTPTSG